MPYSCVLVTVSLSAQITGCILARLIQASAFVVSFLVASHFRLTAPLLYILRAVHRRSRIATLLTIARGASNRSMKPTAPPKYAPCVCHDTLPWLIFFSLDANALSQWQSETSR